MRVLRAVAVIALLAGPAYAQGGPHINLLTDTPSKTQDEIDADAVRDKAYKESLRKIPDAKTSDPWGGVRSGDTPKTSAAKTSDNKTSATKTSKTSAPAKPRTNTGSAAN